MERDRMIEAMAKAVIEAGYGDDLEADSMIAAIAYDAPGGPGERIAELETEVERLRSPYVAAYGEFRKALEGVVRQRDELAEVLREVKKLAAEDAPPAGDGRGRDEPWWSFWNLANEGLVRIKKLDEADGHS